MNLEDLELSRITFLLNVSHTDDTLLLKIVIL